jgi:hypothetical protein
MTLLHLGTGCACSPVTRDAALVSLAHLTAYPHSAAPLRAEGLLPALLAVLSTLSVETENKEALRHASAALRNFLAADAEHISDFLALAASPSPVTVLVDLLSFVTATTTGTPTQESSAAPSR